MQIVVTILQILMAIMSTCLMVLLVYQLVISFFGYGRNTKTYQDHDPKTRFLVLVPAHNEAAVITGIIQNMKQMNYPKELYDFYILADNCEDDTAQVARDAGAKVLEFTRLSPDEPTGKPVVLQKAIRLLEGYQDNYDMVMFFDADNLVSPDMFREVNSQYLDCGESADVIQCYLGCKNNKGLVALFYYVTYTLTNRFFQLAKNRLKLNNVIGGTGFAVNAKYLYNRGGWTAMSLTEDFEMQIESTAEGKRILWNHGVRVFDEKPTRWRASFRQRTRWAQGHWFVTFRNTGRMFKALFQRKIKFWEFFSTMLYMYSLSTYVVLVLQIFISLLYLIFEWTGLTGPIYGLGAGSSTWIMNVISIVIFLYANLFLFYYSDKVDNGNRFDIRTVPKILLSITINYVVVGGAQLLGLIKHRQQKVWVKTEHKINHEQDECLKESMPSTPDKPKEHKQEIAESEIDLPV